MGFLQTLLPMRSTQPEMPQISTALTQTAIDDIMNGIFPPLPVRLLSLKTGEQCFYCDYAVRIIEKLQVVGRRRRGGGVSVRILRGLTCRVGTGGNDLIRDNVPEYTKGKLYLTDKRIVFSASKTAFQKPLEQVVSYSGEGKNLTLQFSDMSCCLFLKTIHCAERVLEHVL